MPRRYLEEFETFGEGLTAVEKTSGKAFDTTPHNFFVEKHLNTVDFFDGSKDQSSLENFFNLIETDYLARISAVRRGEVTATEIDYFVTMALHQLVRTPRVRQQLADLMLAFDQRGLLGAFGDQLSELEEATLEAARTGNKAARNQLGMMVSGHTMMASGALLEGMGFAFLCGNQGLNLITCDNPAIVSGLKIEGRSCTAALPTLGVRRVLIYPIAPDVLLYGSTTLKSGSGFVVFKDANKLTKSMINSVNSFVGLSADRFILLPKNNPALPSFCYRNRLSDAQQTLRIFKGVYSQSICDVTKRLDRLFL
ncbi:MAG: DUF4238 domain-containing protein [Pseudomonadota bacterium]